MALDDRPPSLVERRRVVGRIEAGGLDRLDEQGSGIFGSAEQNTTMAVDVSVEVFVEIEQVGQDQPNGFCPKKEEPEFLNATDGIRTSHPWSRSLQRNSPHFGSSNRLSDVG